MKKFITVTSLLCGILASQAFAQSVQYYEFIVKTLKPQVLEEAEWALKQEPITVTSEYSERSTGGKHDFFSEADYFWPDAKNPGGPYVEIDGKTNPDNFVAHRRAMIRFSKIIGALASAYKITGNDKYVRHAVKHLKAWFVNEATLMNPNLSFSQAVRFKHPGRNYGIIDTIHLMEVAQGTIVLEKSGAFPKQDAGRIKEWFSTYIHWLTTSKMGLQEKTVPNNHSTCWLMQVASFAKLCNDKIQLDSCRTRYKEVILPRQMAIDGSFPLELKRTKPYGYAIFNLDAMVMLCQILSTPQDNLWKYNSPDQKNISKGISFLYPFIEDKSKWTYPPDIMYYENWPVAQPFLIFGSVAFKQENWLHTWQKLDHQPVNEEVIRNLPVRNPLIWL